MKRNLSQHTVTLLGVLVLAGALLTAVLLAVAGERSARQAAPADPEGANHEKEQDEQKDAGAPVKQKGTAALPKPEVLCERTQFGRSGFHGGIDSSGNLELPSEDERKKQAVYALSAVTVPPGGWKIDAVAIYTHSPSRPEGWLKVRRARFNVFPKKGDRPADTENPRRGREVAVTVKIERKMKINERVYDICEVRASDLQLALEPGEYWIGLTPICSDENGNASHLRAHDVRDARFEDVNRQPDAARPEGRGWAANCPPGVHSSIRIEGRRVLRGQVLDWPAEKPEDTKQLHLRFGAFDPLAGLPKIPKELTAPEDGKLWIVQCRQTVDQPARDQLTRGGATLLRYLPDDAYIVRLAPEAVEAVRRLPAVRWAGPYHPAYRLDPNVSTEWAKFDKVIFTESKGWRYLLVYLFDRDEGAKRLVGQIIRDAGGKVLFQSPRGRYLVANVPLDRLAAVAQCDAVCAVERRLGGFEFQGGFDQMRPPSKGNGQMQAPPKGEKGSITLSQIRELCGADAVKKAGGYEGLGVRVAFWDDRVREDHVDLLARPLTVLGPTLWAHGNHGTAIASILGGEGRGDPRARGLLPLGGLVFAAWRGEDPVHEDRYGLVERFVRDHRAVVLSSSSENWGGSGHVKHYDGYSFLLDDLVLEYDLLICTAIGNTTGSGNGHCGSWAKNALLVGGVDPRGSLRREDHRHGHFTSGPALDGRVKPDLVHFGQNVFCADASSPRGYGLFGGTSCATPLVAGHCGLMMEMWADGAFGNLPPGRTVFDRKPHAATARALMINSAYRYPIEGEKPVFTRFQQGWGMPDLGRLYESRKKLFVVDQEIALRDHQAVEYRLRVPENEPELRVTLAYTDPLGTTAAAKALVNDLDLIVIAPDGKRYFGNHGLLESNVSREGGVPDRVNNVENVFLDKPAPGVWRILVAAHRIGWDQRSSTTAWDQDFALVVAGVERDLVPPKPLPK